ncbi:MAG TPA: FixH family protein [Rectinemataceae bacterium]|nr:FixH family protein [Rectinemataceae bacterium]
MNTRFLIPGRGRNLVALLFAFALAASVSAQDATANDDLAKGPVTKELEGGIVARLEILPRPIESMKSLAISVTLTRDGKPVEGAELTLDLGMPAMYMGKNSPTMTETSPGHFEGKGLVTRCMSGDKHWQAEITVKEGGASRKIVFPFIAL